MLKTSLVLSVILFLTLPRAHGQSLSNTWSEVKESGGGTLVIAYSENSPFRARQFVLKLTMKALE